MKNENKKDKLKKIEQVTTGHEWDGIKEYDTPDPAWLRYWFYSMMLIAIVYWLLYPSWPGQHANGVFEWSAQKELAQAQEEITKKRAGYLAEFDKTSFEQIIKDDKLRKFAIEGGKSAFNNNCAVCHGVGGKGNIGYPNLKAGAWLWGGKPDDIYQTIRHGIRSGHEDARDSQMAAFGKDKILTAKQVEALTDFVISLSKGEKGGEQANSLYQENCAICHGKIGEGKHDVGAPALNDAVWLYGSSRENIHDVIYNGRQGVMPYWVGRLDDATIRQLVVYVHQLGSGE